MPENENPDINELYNQEAEIHRPIPEHKPIESYNDIDRLSSPFDKKKKPKESQNSPHYQEDNITPRLSE